MTFDLSALHTEFAAWRAADMRLPIWWRDDDAIQPTPELDRLSAIARRSGVPVHLAVIPKFADHHLATRLENAPEVVPVVHGWAHQNHAPAGTKKTEFGIARTDAAKDAIAGLTKLRELFGDHLVPMFVPPWNRIDSGIFEALVNAGYETLSTFTPRSIAEPVSGLTQINTHIDPIDWHGTRGIVEPYELISGIVRLLQDRRSAKTDNAEPLGLLTHHLVHPPEVWDFTEQLLNALVSGPTDVFCARPPL
ncbi:MAG: polysaccharide deacetylase family protein [Paracoccaceae bacterium]